MWSRTKDKVVHSSTVGTSDGHAHRYNPDIGQRIIPLPLTYEMASVRPAFDLGRSEPPRVFGRAGAVGVDRDPQERQRVVQRGDAVAALVPCRAGGGGKSSPSRSRRRSGLAPTLRRPPSNANNFSHLGRLKTCAKLSRATRLGASTPTSPSCRSC